MTATKIAMRTLWAAGRYLEAQQHAAMFPFERITAQARDLAEATLIVARLYNQVVWESKCSKGAIDSTQTTA